MAARCLVVMVAFGALIAAACAGGGSPTADPTPTLGPGRGVLGGTDTDRHSVALSAIHFDTFRGGTIPLSDIDEATLLSLRDAIPPIDQPRYEPAESVDWLAPSDLIVGYVAADGQAYAYPTSILNFHEIVNDELAGQQILISYCPLCRSAVVYDRNLGNRLLSFGNTSALFQSDLVMYDRETLSYWFQVAGEAIVGTLAGERLTPLPSVTTSWQQWRELHSDTMVLSRDTGFLRDYGREPLAGLAERINEGGFLFPVTEAALDDRLEPATLVLGVELDGEARAYDIEALGDAATNDRIGSQRVVIFSRAEGPIAVAFRADEAGRELEFELSGGRFLDTETGSEWTLRGEAIAGELAGEQLEALPVRTTFWFAYVASFPDATVYED